MADALEPAPFTWKRLEKLEAAISWRRDEENSAVANIWHLETVAELAEALRAMIEQRELDERLITLLWAHVPGDDRVDVATSIEAPGSIYPNGGARLSQIVSPPAKPQPPRRHPPAPEGDPGL